MNSSLYPAIYPQTVLAVKITAGITCALSFFGNALIILTYVVFKDLRTTSRQLLVNLSVADIIVVLSHFVGLFANFERFLPPEDFVNSTTDALCVIQGAFSVYGTVASFLWSILIAVHLIVMILFRRQLLTKILVPIFYIASWGIPVIVIIIEGALKYFGFEPVSNAGWCYTQISHVSLVAQILGYEIWLIIAFLVVTILYLVLFCYIRCNIRVNKSNRWSLLGVAKGDIKLLLVPVIFFLLRIWNQVIDGILHYSNHDEDMIDGFKHSVVAAVLVVFSGIGLNAQGFSNVILFCAFTTQVRRRLTSATFKFLRWCLQLVCRCELCVPCERVKHKLIGQDHRMDVALEESIVFSNSASNGDSTALLEDSYIASRPSSLLTYGSN